MVGRAGIAKLSKAVREVAKKNALERIRKLRVKEDQNKKREELKKLEEQYVAVKSKKHVINPNK